MHFQFGPSKPHFLGHLSEFIDSNAKTFFKLLVMFVADRGRTMNRFSFPWFHAIGLEPFTQKEYARAICRSFVEFAGVG
jgi:hypothetical protein